MSSKQPRYFQKPDDDEPPVGFWALLLIIVATHLGVRSRKQRADDFKRVNGLHLFIGGLIYFALIILALALLVRYLVL